MWLNMNLIVIEGDNGTGKDTLALKLAEHGYDILSYFPNVKAFENQAKNCIDRTKAFIDYNQFCGNLSRSAESSVIIIRYWISTLAAAYTDYAYDYDEIISLTDELKTSMPMPDIVIRLWVNANTRINRISLRNLDNPNLLDDVSIERAHRYEWISKEILNRSGYHWKEFDNSTSNIDHLANEVLEYINRGDKDR